MNPNLKFLETSLGGRARFGDPMGFWRKEPSFANINDYIAPIQFERLAHDVGMWRDAIRESEHPFYPKRVKMMRMFIDTVENIFIKALIQRCMEIVLQRDMFLYEVKGGEKIVSETATQALREQYWFQDYLEYVLEAAFWGYSLISLGDIVNDSFPEIRSIRRENINVDGWDGAYIASMVYSMNGISLNDPLMELCNHYIKTKSNRGVSRCGNGLLYNLAYGEINMRHIDEWNIDFLELYGMPIRVGTTSKVGKERKQFENYLRYAASDQYVLLDKGTEDKIEFVHNSGATGTTWKGYENLSNRIKKACSQLVLGHEDAMASSAGKLGGQQTGDKDGNKTSLVEQAMNSKQITYGNFVSNKVNEKTESFRKLGKFVGSKVIENIFPSGLYFGLLNDVEEEAVRRKNDAHRIRVSESAKQMNDAGYNIDVDELSKEYGMKLTEQAPERKLIEEKKTEATIIKEDSPSLKNLFNGKRKTQK